MIATTTQTPAAQLPHWHAAPEGARPAASGGAGRPVAGDRRSAILNLSPQAAARYAGAANQGSRAAAAPAAAPSLGANTLDTADANENGKVSVKEQQAYDSQWVAKQAVRWAAHQREVSQALPRPYGAQASARYGAVQALAA